MVTRCTWTAAVLVAVVGCQPADPSGTSGDTSAPAAVETAGRLVNLSVPNMT